MADKRDYYEILGITRTAAADEIKRAYRQLARKYHPDVNKEPDAESRFKEITEAYEVLSDQRKRQMYDQFGHAGARGGAGAAGFEGFPFGDIGDLFESFFGGDAGSRRGPQRGNDLRLRMDLTFEEAVFGVEREVEIPRWETCLICGGSGAEPGKPPVRCPQCSGTGEIRRIQTSVFGQFVNVMPCGRCRGEGTIVEHKCQECGGNGRKQRQRKIQVTVPAGVDDGTEMRIPGQGEGGDRGGPSGDLYVVFNVAPHPVLRRDGFDLVYELPLNIARAALGDEVSVPTLEGEQRLTIPAGTQHGKVFRIREKGVPRLQRSGISAGRGDFRVVVRVEVPKNLTARQRELLAELADTFEGRGEVTRQPVESRSGEDGQPARKRKKDKGKG
ncbi:MAG TPA: molecular chaperone DnaJ, partial [Chloroflexota bacterium]|nr:molecular chaperone DnaJ [Chloroflexota bacterium]